MKKKNCVFLLKGQVINLVSQLAVCSLIYIFLFQDFTESEFVFMYINTHFFILFLFVFNFTHCQFVIIHFKYL